MFNYGGNKEIFAYLRSEFPGEFNSIVDGNQFESKRSIEKCKKEIIARYNAFEKTIDRVYNIRIPAEFRANNFDFKTGDFKATIIPTRVFSKLDVSCYGLEFNIPVFKISETEAEKMLDGQNSVYLPIVFKFKILPREKNEAYNPNDAMGIPKKRIIIQSLTLFKDVGCINVLFSEGN